ncbi:LuxR family transcriptional regulator [Amycolatopsis endophytica]|uniref:Putative ATPase/DNA-binding CsgD family transcriptional regulator n=1 Tax=Amycolatopsis endophytica TaxID=860233 RepID=A0A853B611_9PSEU|nr:LuxR C-terminal-related transcriptional regulator [Amycolatopsis endophytica]NYI90207.1 putative ATPase/DNA-binding CsgD family transcriptional regulator [Amycolatopsis endophytica]
MAGTLPNELTSFVGRRQELSDIRRLLSTARLVTLTGLGGVGKTRLAVRAAVGLKRAFPDGVRFAELAALDDPVLLPQTVATALGLRDEAVEPADRLAQFLGDRQVLLVLDNCEHLTDACATLLGKLLAATSGLRVLATSRQRLSVEGEHLLPVEPLTLPERPGAAEGSNGWDAMSLFADRAAAVSPGFELNAGNESLIGTICRRIEGLPLAIELAAVWLRTLSLTDLNDRLADRFALLAEASRTAPPRQQGLEALVDWSYQLCLPAEQRLWERLSTFRGGFDLPAAEYVCAGDGIEAEEVLGLLAGLVDKSVLVRDRETYGHSARYRMLETLAEFGTARLAADRAPDEPARRHRDYYRDLARRFAEEKITGRQQDWITRLQAEHPNLRAALESWLEEPDPRPALEIAGNLSVFWIAGGHLVEGSRWLNRVLARNGKPSAERARALHASLLTSTWLGVRRGFAGRLREYRTIAAALGDPVIDAELLVCEGVSRYFLGDPERACELLEQAHDACGGLGDDGLALQILPYLALARFVVGQPDAEKAGEQAVELCAAHGNPPWYTALALWVLGLAVWQRGDLQRAKRLQRDAIRLREPAGDPSGIALSLETLAWCATAERRFNHAARLLGAAATAWRLSGAGRIEPALQQVSETRAALPAREALGRAAFEQEHARGAAMSFEKAVAFALDERRAQPAPETGARHPLTARESEIAGLVAKGLSNRQIAGQLVISQRTAETHVEHILAKMGFTSRSQIAAWVTANET